MTPPLSCPLVPLPPLAFQGGKKELGGMWDGELAGNWTLVPSDDHTQRFPSGSPQTGLWRDPATSWVPPLWGPELEERGLCWA